MRQQKNSGSTRTNDAESRVFCHGRLAAKEWFRIGISANTTGISVYILGIKDKTYLAQTYGEKLGKASVTGYCIKFKKLSEINVDILQSAIQFGLTQ